MRIIAGPCQHETLEQSLAIAKECKRVCDLFDIEYIFKASFDKANRTSINGKRGVGLKNTLYDFREIKNKLGVNTLTDVHDMTHIVTINSWNSQDPTIDVLQIPAFLCRQTDLIQAACRSGLTVNIKKGQFLAPWDVKGILSKTEGAKEVWITERGTSFGYNTLVTDFTGIQYMRDNFPVPVVFDVTHSVQKPGGQGDSSGGNRAYVPALANAAAGMGVDNFFLEVHPDPDNAPSDGPNMLRLEDFAETVRQLYWINKTVKGFE
jgi:2-dehydro-3-deoxyphosphooctonate aldolase (KDO 8-P synthase)